MPTEQTCEMAAISEAGEHRSGSDGAALAQLGAGQVEARPDPRAMQSQPDRGPEGPSQRAGADPETLRQGRGIGRGAARLGE